VCIYIDIYIVITYQQYYCVPEVPPWVDVLVGIYSTHTRQQRWCTVSVDKISIKYLSLFHHIYGITNNKGKGVVRISSILINVSLSFPYSK
jgi:hypothetical protein